MRSLGDEHNILNSTGQSSEDSRNVRIVHLE